MSEYVHVKRDLYGLKRKDFESTASKLEDQRMQKSVSVMSKIEKESKRVDDKRFMLSLQSEGARLTKINENELKYQLIKDCAYANNKLNSHKR